MDYFGHWNNYQLCYCQLWKRNKKTHKGQERGSESWKDFRSNVSCCAQVSCCSCISNDYCIQGFLPPLLCNSVPISSLKFINPHWIHIYRRWNPWWSSPRILCKAIESLSKKFFWSPPKRWLKKKMINQPHRIDWRSISCAVS